jgi:hypothetical protein
VPRVATDPLAIHMDLWSPTRASARPVATVPRGSSQQQGEGQFCMDGTCLRCLEHDKPCLWQCKRISPDSLDHLAKHTDHWPPSRLLNKGPPRREMCGDTHVINNRDIVFCCAHVALPERDETWQTQPNPVFYRTGWTWNFWPFTLTSGFPPVHWRDPLPHFYVEVANNRDKANSVWTECCCDV